MNIFIFAILVLIVAALFFYAVDQIELQQPFKGLIKALILILAAVVIANRAGLL